MFSRGGCSTAPEPELPEQLRTLSLQGHRCPPLWSTPSAPAKTAPRWDVVVRTTVQRITRQRGDPNPPQRRCNGLLGDSVPQEPAISTWERRWSHPWHHNEALVRGRVVPQRQASPHHLVKPTCIATWQDRRRVSDTRSQHRRLVPAYIAQEALSRVSQLALTVFVSRSTPDLPYSCSRSRSRRFIVPG